MAQSSVPAYFPKVAVPKALRRVHGVVETVHYDQDGRVRWVRAYLRRFDAFSDRVVLSRDELIARLKAGQTFVLGKQQDPFLGNVFEIGPALRLAEKQGHPFLVLEGQPLGERELEGAPVL